MLLKVIRLLVMLHLLTSFYSERERKRKREGGDRERKERKKERVGDSERKGKKERERG